MNSITIHRLSLQFDAGQITHGTPEEQAAQAIILINAVLQREPFGLCAQLIATRDEIEVESATEPPCEACDDKGWLQCNVGNDQSPQSEIQRCDACEQYDSDQAAREAAAKAAESSTTIQRKENTKDANGANQW
ncbi:MAG: hypothetical protein ABSG78_13170 [Verrucomicrobiota bacterium]|jgi:hypothetical protein